MKFTVISCVTSSDLHSFRWEITIIQIGYLPHQEIWGGSPTGNVSFLCEYFWYFSFDLVLQSLLCCLHVHFFQFSYVGFIQLFESVGLCLLANLVNFQLLILSKSFILTHFWDSSWSKSLYLLLLLLSPWGSVDFSLCYSN